MKVLKQAFRAFFGCAFDKIKLVVSAFRWKSNSGAYKSKSGVRVWKTFASRAYTRNSFFGCKWSRLAQYLLDGILMNVKWRINYVLFAYRITPKRGKFRALALPSRNSSQIFTRELVLMMLIDFIKTSLKLPIRRWKPSSECDGREQLATWNWVERSRR